MLRKALMLCCEIHKDQVDKGGAPYYMHPITVALKMETEEQKIVALLHDVVEDSDTTLDDLRSMGFSDRIVDAVNAVTKKDGESYGVYLKKIKENDLAKAVKLGDLEHNSDLSRLNRVPTEKDYKRVYRYQKAKEYLLGLRNFG